ncbi:hypothetical protein [Pedobacter sp. JY14-1]|uniref:hypothetical protein n=1 Tax=Pedobacter sp. JY14-1 TaxID=3034151 RepID=UPI0023E270C3|nr:hypothetical protein [Pedobacter sp. JY14-1]
MKYKKLIYFRYMPLTRKVIEDFYMQDAEKLGVEVEYWDITRLFFKEDFQMEDNSDLVKTVKFDDLNEFEASVKAESGHPDVLFLSIITFEAKVQCIFQILGRYNAKTAVFGRNMFPLPQAKNRSFLSRLARLNARKVSIFVKNKFLIFKKRLGWQKGYDIIFIGGEQGWRGIGNIGFEEVKKARLIKVNSDDYDNSLLNRDTPPLLDGEYILFLDEYLPLHPDTKLFHIKTVKPEDYYPQLCRFFKRLENRYGMPVIIAAHPKALRYHEEDFFQGRKVIFGKTAILSKYAQVVLAHDSTSINYPICFGTPLHFISSEAIKKSIYSVHENSSHFAKFLNCGFSVIDYDEPDLDFLKKIDDPSYNKYKYSFQTWPETEQRQTRDIFIDFLKA